MIPANPEDAAAPGTVYRGTLLDDVIPFWLRHGLDHEHGGFLTVLDRDGSVIDTDKSAWFQGRGAWTFSTLYLTVERRPGWLDAARSGVEFLRSHGFAPDSKIHRDGRVSSLLKGNMWKGPFHLPRMLWYCWRLLDQDAEPAGQT